eukprot:CAMPEP_0172784408 /NCGR_PEP_ID=MMETSP1074-20121228/204922_1 /TAXON_ID=2916 /ORGANISM="Ceratium fusus, Strain PA161109" /LENGTH=617 /DNA_ID=CAMNT_0013621411 /DNA_START=46 /DNA_END=1899 /DNA_ORIENTATION=-
MMLSEEVATYDPSTSRFLRRGSPDETPAASPKVDMRDSRELPRQVAVGRQPLKLRNPAHNRNRRVSINEALDDGVPESNCGNALRHHVSTHAQATGANCRGFGHLVADALVVAQGAVAVTECTEKLLKTALDHKIQQLRHELNKHHLKSQDATESQQAVENGVEAATEAASNLKETEQRVYEAQQDQLATINSLNELLDRAWTTISNAHSAKSEQHAITLREIEQELGEIAQELPTTSASAHVNKTATHVQSEQHAITLREIEQELGEIAQELPTTSASAHVNKTATHVLPFIEDSKYRLSKLEDQYQQQDAAVATALMRLQELGQTQERMIATMQALADMQSKCAKQCEPVVDVVRLFERIDRLEETKLQSGTHEPAQFPDLRQQLEQMSPELLVKTLPGIASQLRSTEATFVRHLQQVREMHSNSDSFHKSVEDRLQSLQSRLETMELQTAKTSVCQPGYPVEPSKQDAVLRSHPGNMAAPSATEACTSGCPLEACRQDAGWCSLPGSLAAPIATEACTFGPVEFYRQTHEGLTRTLSAAVPLVTRQVAGSVASLPVRLDSISSDTAIGLASRIASRRGMERAMMPPPAHVLNSTQTQGASPKTPRAAAAVAMVV